MIRLSYQILAIFLLISIDVDTIHVANAAEPEQAKSLRYINDRQVVRIRKGRSDKDKIVTSASSGTELVFISQKGKYSQVRTKSGKTGWLLSVYLRKTPIARVRLKAVSQSLTQAKSDIKTKDIKLKNLSVQYKKLRQKHQRLENDYTLSQQENKKLNIIASDPIRLTNENKKLSMMSAEMQENIRALRAEMSELRDDTNKQWFLNGAGVVLLGVLIGLLLPKLRQQRKSDWSNY